MRILLVTDAWQPQTNGVVNTLSHTVSWLRRFGHEVVLANPAQFATIPCPTYPEIRISLFPYQRIAAFIREQRPQAIHIATEGPLGFASRRYCLRNGLRFTTSYHTQFPQYLKMRLPIPLRASYRALRWFHGAATHCMVSTDTVRNDLASFGFRNLVRWQRGVDTELFKPGDKQFLSLPRPIAAYVGRLAVEKNVDAFLRMDWSGSKLVVGDGPERARLQARYPKAVFVGFRYGADLAAHLGAADVMVFPSRTDTFGLVNLEAMACAVPVAAFPVAGPRDVIRDGLTGALDEDLAAAASRALRLNPADCRAYALDSGWDRCSRQFENHLVGARVHAHSGMKVPAASGVTQADG